MRQPLWRSRRRAKTFSIKKREFHADCDADANCGPATQVRPAPDTGAPTWRPSWALTLKAAAAYTQPHPAPQPFWLTALDYERSVGHSGDSPFDPSGNSDSSQNQLLAVRSNGQPVETSQVPHPSSAWVGNHEPSHDRAF